MSEDNKESEIILEESKANEVAVEIVEPEQHDGRLDKAYDLFAEFHGVLDEAYTSEQKVAKFKELKTELETVIGYKDTEFEELKNSKMELEAKYKKLEDTTKTLSKLADSFKKMKYSANFGDKSLEQGRSEQEIYDSLSPIEQSKYLNSLRKARGN